MKKFFITKDNKVRWVKVFITENIEWDDGKTHLVVSMENNLNEANRPSDCKIESIDVGEFFETLKEAQYEIIRKERFEKKPTQNNHNADCPALKSQPVCTCGHLQRYS